MATRRISTVEIGRALRSSAAVLAVAICLLAAQLGRSTFASRELEQEYAMAAETNAVCARLGHPRSAEEFVDCAIELDGVRQHERARVLLETGGLL